MDRGKHEIIMIIMMKTHVTSTWVSDLIPQAISLLKSTTHLHQFHEAEYISQVVANVFVGG